MTLLAASGRSPFARLLRTLAPLAAALTIVLSSASSAHAQEIHARYKGTIGLGLIVAELGFYIPSAFHYTETWSMITFPIVVAAGGAVGGYYIDRLGSPPASVSILAVGLALAVPTVILTVGNSRYSTDDLQDDTEARAYRRQMAGAGFLRRMDGEWALSMPGIAVNPVLRVDADTGRTSRSAELSITLISGSF